MNAKQQIAKRRADMPRKYRKLYDRVVSGKGSPRDAIKSFCLECVGWQKEEIRLCTGVACPLYNYRGYTTPESCQVPDSATSESQNGKSSERMVTHE